MSAMSHEWSMWSRFIHRAQFCDFDHCIIESMTCKWFIAVVLYKIELQYIPELFKVGKFKIEKKVMKSKMSFWHNSNWYILDLIFTVLFFLNFILWAVSVIIKKMFQMCFQSEVQYRKFALIPREVWNVLAVPFLPWSLHTFPLCRARSRLSLVKAIVRPWTALWVSPDKPKCCELPWPTPWRQEGLAHKNPIYVMA